MAHDASAADIAHGVAVCPGATKTLRAVDMHSRGANLHLARIITASS